MAWQNAAVAVIASAVATVNSWVKAQIGTPVALTSTSAHIAVDLALGNNFSHTFTESTTLDNPTNIVAGQSGQIYLTQHASAAKTLAYGGYWLPFDGTTPSVSTTVGAINVISYTVFDSTHIFFALNKHGVA